VERVIFLHGGALGDFVMSLRVVAAMRASGAREVAVVGRRTIAEVALSGGGVDRVLDLDAGGLHFLFSPDVPAPPALAAELNRFDTAVDMLGGPVTAGRLHQLGIGRVVYVDPKPRLNRHGHISDQWLADLAAAGLMVEVGPPVIVVDAEARAAAREQLRLLAGDVEGPKTILHCGSGSAEKCWPMANFIQLVEALRQIGWTVLTLLGPVERDRWSAPQKSRLMAAAPGLDEPELRRVAGLLTAADLYIGCDSGISHLAAAVGAPTLAIFGPTDPVRWRPLGGRVGVARGDGDGQWPTVAAVAEAAQRLHQDRSARAG